MMNDISKKALDAITEKQAYANALNDPDNPLMNFGALVKLRKEDGRTLLECFRKALEREKKISLIVRYDADVVRWYEAKGKGYQAVMNAALRRQAAYRQS